MFALSVSALLALVVGPSWSWAQPGAAPAEPPALERVEPIARLHGPVPLMRVVDGDTIVVESNIGPRTVRLIGIDAPELESGERSGREAQAHLARLLEPGELLWLEFDLGLEDIYGRLLAYVYVPDADGLWQYAGVPLTQVNLAMVDAGWARPLTVEPNRTYADLYMALAERALAAERGIWAPAHASGAGDATDGAPEGQKAAAAPIRLHCGLLNPTADNDVGEWVSVMLDEPYDTRGYYLFDMGSGAIFRLPAGVQPAGELIIPNPGQGVWNNSGDVVYLMRGGEVMDSWAYEGHEARSGEIVCRD